MLAAEQFYLLISLIPIFFSIQHAVAVAASIPNPMAMVKNKIWIKCCELLYTIFNLVERIKLHWKNEIPFYCLYFLFEWCSDWSQAFPLYMRFNRKSLPRSILDQMIQNSKTQLDYKNPDRAQQMWSHYEIRFWVISICFESL